jgi:hypothetical protein
MQYGLALGPAVAGMARDPRVTAVQAQLDHEQRRLDHTRVRNEPGVAAAAE